MRESRTREACGRLLDLLPERFDEFVRLYSDPEEGLEHLPVFKYCSPDELFQKIKRLENSSIRDLAVLIERRYGAFAEAHLQDYESLHRLNGVLEESLAGTKVDLSTYLLSRLKVKMQAAIASLKGRLEK